MLHYCLKCIKNMDSKNPEVTNANKEKLMLLSKCAVCDSKILRFIKNQEPEKLLSMTDEIPILGLLLI